MDFTRCADFVFNTELGEVIYVLLVDVEEAFKDAIFLDLVAWLDTLDLWFAIFRLQSFRQYCDIHEIVRTSSLVLRVVKSINKTDVWLREERVFICDLSRETTFILIE